MRVDHQSAQAALDRLDGKIPGEPLVTVILSEPDADGISEMTLEGSFHATEEGVAFAIGLEPPRVIDRYTPSTVGHVVSEPARPPSSAAARASTQEKGRLMPVKRVKAPPAGERDIIEANVAAKPPRNQSRRRKDGSNKESK